VELVVLSGSGERGDVIGSDSLTVWYKSIIDYETDAVDAV